MSDVSETPCPHCGCPPGEKLAPVQGYQPGIPWSMHLRAYDAYCKRYGPQKALIEGWCRGGFATGELDMFIPGWREEVAVLSQLQAALHAAEAREEKLREAAIDMDKQIGRLFWTTDDGVELRDGSPEDCDTPSPFREAWEKMRSALSPTKP
jgi:hypothetical protein